MIARRTYVWLALALSAVLFFGVNMFANTYFTDARIDLTASRQYTLSDGTKGIIAKLPEPVTLRFYFSKKNSAHYPVTAAYAGRVRDLLGEYAQLSHGKIILEDVDPEPYTPEEDRATAAGIRPAPTQTGEVVYFGLEGINSIDTKEVIPFFDPGRESDLEYDLTSLLYTLSHPAKAKLAIVSALPLQTGPTGNGPLTIYSQLRQAYDVTDLPANFAKIPDGTNVVLIAHPQNLGAPQLKAIEFYALKGGRLLVFVDPLSELIRQQSSTDVKPSSNLVPLLSGWGVDYVANKVVLDRKLAQAIQSSDDPRQSTIPYPMWLHLTRDNFAARDPVTSSLQSMNLASVGVLSPSKGATTRFEPLVTTSDQASLFDRDRLLKLKDPNGLMDEIKPTGKPFTIAARITGRAVYPGVTSGNVNIIVVADTDIFDDRFWVNSSSGTPQPFADNEGLVLNAVENLSGSDDLISLRMRGNTDRPFTRVRALQADAELKFRETLQALRARLTSSEQEIAQLQQGAGSNAISLTPQQQAEIARVRQEIAGTRGELRDVQHNLRADIDRLGTVLALINMLLVPALVAGFAVVLGIIRRRRRA